MPEYDLTWKAIDVYMAKAPDGSTIQEVEDTMGESEVLIVVPASHTQTIDYTQYPILQLRLIPTSKSHIQCQLGHNSHRFSPPLPASTCVPIMELYISIVVAPRRLVRSHYNGLR